MKLVKNQIYNKPYTKAWHKINNIQLNAYTWHQILIQIRYPIWFKIKNQTHNIIKHHLVDSNESSITS